MYAPSMCGMAITIGACYNGWVNTAQCSIMLDTLQKINDGLWIEGGAKFVLFIGKLGFTDHDRDVNIDDDGTKGNVQAVWQYAICFAR